MIERYFNSIIKTLLIFLSVNCNGQTFEGTLTYKVDFEVLPKMKKMGMTKPLLEEQMRKEGQFYEKQAISYSKTGFFHVRYEDNIKSWAIYRPDSNKLYTFKKASDTCVVTDVSIDTENELTQNEPQVIILDTVLTVFNKSCNVIRVKWQSGYFDYAYHTGLFKVNPAVYQNYKYDGWSEFIKKSGCLPLQITKVTGGMMSITYTLVDFKDEELSNAIFVVPELVPIETSIMPLIKNKQIAIVK